ncbi:MAG: TonB-dependent receptor [Chitinophagaceae bacterium]|uniref:TonB-dependent receptor n=1 Tax=unclassified Paraflavitalea TaxID=2798305 RepID=UPI003D3412BA|nr:TonB-dependent receptor [Chitinophagaceae bacterium]
MLKRIVRLMLALLVFPLAMYSQETNSSISGVVKTSKGEPLVGATITATHVPTGTVYRVATRTGGRYNIYNLRPGGPYTIVVSFVGFNDEKKEDIFLSLGENSSQEFSLKDKSTNLTEVTVVQRRTVSSGKGGTETSIGRDKMANLPNVGRGLNDYLKYTPQVKITGDGGVSFVGQNNRYNSFFIDGSNNTDIFGLAASGTNGGQAGVAPISIDAIDQIQVILSPFDAQFGNFTGGAINAVTKSGTNQIQASAWTFYRNQSITGKSPVPVAKAGFPNVYERTRVPNFENKTYGIRVGGPIVKNKLFYFFLAEWQRDQRPQPFNYADYRGTTSQAGVEALGSYLKTTYGYDPGGFLNNPELVNADRINTKIDWNINDNNRLSVSYRYNKGLRYNTSTSSSTTINFYNNGYIFPNRTSSLSAELKSTLKNNTNNRLLVTYTDELDDRGPLGQAFPRVSIFDGSGTIVFGTENFSAANLLKAKNLTIFDALKFYRGNHVMSIGTDNEFNDALNTFIRDNFGTYQFNSLADFYSGARPRTYSRSFSLVDGATGDNTNAAAKFRTLRMGFFFTDEVKVNENFSLVLGIRADRTELLTKPLTDKFFNDTAIGKISQYYDLKGARSGQTMDARWMISPRVGFTYRIPEEGMVIRGGMGVFAGRVPLVWPGGIYNNNGVSVGGVQFTTQATTPAFNADPFNQPTAAQLGQNISNSRGQIDLVAKNFRLPTVFRASLAMDKRLGNGWTFTTEAVFTKNIWEIEYTNVNIVPPIGKSNTPDSRNVYSLTSPVRIPMTATGANPYPGNIFLLSNNTGRRGYSYSLTFTLDKAFRNGFAFNANYTFGSSVSLNEGTSSQNNSQWRFMETVNGRNYMELSTSDFDLGHRINAFVSKEFTYAHKSMATVISLVYNGQSGSPFSYVYRNSPVVDQATGETNDLIYIPTATELQNMTFLSNTVGGVTYTPQQQKDMYEAYIQGDKYLKKNRGRFAERNGARLPFTNNLDIKLEQKFFVKMAGRKYTLSLTYDVYNFTNMLNKDWGRTWFLSNDQFAVVNFAGYVSAANLTPQYRFSPVVGKPWGVSTSLTPGYTARWISQLGIRLSF